MSARSELIPGTGCHSHTHYEGCGCTLQSLCCGCLPPRYRQPSPAPTDERKLVAEQKFGGYQLHVFQEGEDFWTWLDTEVAECDGLCIGVGKSIRASLTNAARTLTSTLNAAGELDYRQRAASATTQEGATRGV